MRGALNHWFIYVICGAAVVTTYLFCHEKDEDRKRAIPKPPLIVIEITYEEATGIGAYRYKAVDQNGYVFYSEEPAYFKHSPTHQLGDTLR